MLAPSIEPDLINKSKKPVVCLTGLTNLTAKATKVYKKVDLCKTCLGPNFLFLFCYPWFSEFRKLFQVNFPCHLENYAHRSLSCLLYEIPGQAPQLE